MMAPSSLPAPLHDREAARAFLDVLGPAEDFLFAFKPDRPDTPWPKGCPAHIYGKLESAWPIVQRFNNAANGIGVFIVVNVHKRFEDENHKIRRGGQHVTRVRAAFVDADSTQQVDQVEAFLAQGLEPNAVVFTGRGRHYYWLLDDAPLERFRPIQRAMADRFGTDPSVSDLARIMRLPGTLHVKADPSAVTCTINHGRKVRDNQLTTVFDLHVIERQKEQFSKDSAVMLPAGFGPPASVFAGTMSEIDELAAGVAQWQVQGAKDAGLTLASAGALNSREPWLNLILLPFTDLAQEHPEYESLIKAAYDDVSQASASSGANIAQNDAQWDAQMRVAPRQGGRTIASTFAEVAKLSALTQQVKCVSSTSAKKSAQTSVHGAGGGTLPTPFALGYETSRRDAFSSQREQLSEPRSLDFSSVPPHRRWVLGHRLVKGEVTILAAPGGRAKSSIAVAWACSLACGRSLVGEWVYGGPKRVLYISLEDDVQELQRRFYAAVEAHALNPADVARIKVAGVDTTRISLTTGAQGLPCLDEAGLGVLRRHIQSTAADVVILDPLASAVPAGLNDNGLIAGLMARLKAMAVENDFACLVIHHFKKGADHTAESVGGASAIANHARAVFGVEAADQKEASSLGVMPSEKWRLLRITDLKLNLAPRLEEAKWLYLTSVTLPNAWPPEYPNGDSVQAVTRFTPPALNSSEFGGIDPGERQRIQSEFLKRLREAQDAGQPLYANKGGPKASGIQHAGSALADIVRAITGRPLADCEVVAASVFNDLMLRGVVANAEVKTSTRHKRCAIVVGPKAYKQVP